MERIALVCIGFVLARFALLEEARGEKCVLLWLLTPLRCHFVTLAVCLNESGT